MVLTAQNIYSTFQVVGRCARICHAQTTLPNMIEIILIFC